MALEIPTKSGSYLLRVIRALFPRIWDISEAKTLKRLVNQLFCQAALTNDLARAKQATKAACLKRGDSVGGMRFSLDDAYVLGLPAGEDEYGVRCERLMYVSNPLRIAAALSHMEILEWLLSPDGQCLLGGEKPSRHQTTSHRDNPILRRHSCTRFANDSILLDARREAVQAVFIDPERLPISVKPAANVEALQLILSKSEELQWDREVIMAAETTGADVFRVLVNHVDLGKRIPQRRDRKGPGLFADGVHARTVGEISLRRALKAGNLDNAKLLLEKCLVLAGTLRSNGISGNDSEAIAILNGLEGLKVPGMRPVVRTMKVVHWIDEGARPDFEQIEPVKDNNRQFVWRSRQKMKGTDSSSFELL